MPLFGAGSSPGSYDRWMWFSASKACAQRPVEHCACHTCSLPTFPLDRLNTNPGIKAAASLPTVETTDSRCGGESFQWITTIPA